MTMKPAAHKGDQARGASDVPAPLTGTGVLVGLLLRRDRLKLPAWIGGLGLFVLYIGAALPQLAPTENDLESIVPLLSQPVGRMFTGPAFGMDVPTYERFFAAGYAPYLFLLAALMNIMLVTRHTRAEEQSGRAELIRANVVGRHAALTAAVLVAAIANVLAAMVVTGLAIAVGYAPTGSMLIGLGTGLTGMAFAAITAAAAQVNEYSRAAAGTAGAVLGAAFALRAVGDMAAEGGSTLSWISPLGWPAQTAAYVHDRWAPLSYSVGLAAVALVAAYALQARRDFGASLMVVRRGAGRARPHLGRPLGLAARLQCSSALAWGGGIVALGVVDGAFTQAMIDAGDDMPAALQELFGTQGLLDGYVAFLGSFVGVLTAAYVVFAMQTLRAEESRGRADLVLATPLSRADWLRSHVLIIALGAGLILLVAGLGTAVAAAGVTGRRSFVGDVVWAHLSMLPAVLFVLAVTAVLFGLVPRLMVPVGGVLVTLMALVAFFAALLDLPQWLRALSPLDHLAEFPVEEFVWTPFLTLSGVGVVVAAAGVAAFRWRQVGSG